MNLSDKKWKTFFFKLKFKWNKDTDNFAFQHFRIKIRSISKNVIFWILLWFRKNIQNILASLELRFKISFSFLKKKIIFWFFNVVIKSEPSKNILIPSVFLFCVPFVIYVQALFEIKKRFAKTTKIEGVKIIVFIIRCLWLDYWDLPFQSLFNSWGASQQQWVLAIGIPKEAPSERRSILVRLECSTSVTFESTKNCFPRGIKHLARFPTSLFTLTDLVAPESDTMPHKNTFRKWCRSSLCQVATFLMLLDSQITVPVAGMFKKSKPFCSRKPNWKLKLWLKWPNYIRFENGKVFICSQYSCSRSWR